MRHRKPAWTLLGGALSWVLAPLASAQLIPEAGFQLTKDESGRVIAADYCGRSQVEYQLRRVGVTQADFLPIDRLDEFPNLARVFFPYGTSLSAEDVRHLSGLQSLSDLEMGFVGASGESVSVQGGLSGLSGLKGLKRLHLSLENIGDDDLQFVAALPKLQSFEFNAGGSAGRWDGEGSGSGCTDRCADFVGQASALKDLWVHDAEGLTDGFVSTVTAGLPELESLDLSSSELTDESLRLLAERCAGLSSLNLESPRFTDDGVAYLKGATSLRELSLNSRSLGGRSIGHVGGLHRLEELGLTVASVDDEDVRALVGLRELERLVLRKPALTDAQFAMFREHPRLKSAFINGTGLSVDAAIEVIQSIPNIEHLEFGGNRKLQQAVDKVLGRGRFAR